MKCLSLAHSSVFQYNSTRRDDDWKIEFESRIRSGTALLNKSSLFEFLLKNEILFQNISLIGIKEKMSNLNIIALCTTFAIPKKFTSNLVLKKRSGEKCGRNIANTTACFRRVNFQWLIPL